MCCDSALFQQRQKWDRFQAKKHRHASICLWFTYLWSHSQTGPVQTATAEHRDASELDRKCQAVFSFLKPKSPTFNVQGQQHKEKKKFLPFKIFSYSCHAIWTDVEWSFIGLLPDTDISCAAQDQQRSPGLNNIVNCTMVRVAQSGLPSKPFVRL